MKLMDANNRFFARAMPWYLIAGAASFAGILSTQSSMVSRFSSRVAWLLTPYRSLPTIFDGPGFVSWYDHSESAIGVFELACVWILAAIILSLLAMAAHVISFYIAVFLHKRFGRPRYWSAATPGLDRRELLVRTARATCWLTPSGIAISSLLDSVAFWLQYVRYPLISRGSWTSIIVIPAALVLAEVFICLRYIRSAISRSVSADERICPRCNYQLRGVESDRCPECARTINRLAPADYGLLRPGSKNSRRITACALICVVASLLMSPVWVPSFHQFVWDCSMRHFPIAMRRFAPRWSPQYFVFYHPDQFPIRPDAACITIRRAGSAARLRFFKKGPVPGHYDVSFWSNEAQMALQPPDSQSSGFLNSSNGTIPIGPWSFKYWDPAPYMIWFIRPNSTFQIEVSDL